MTRPVAARASTSSTTVQCLRIEGSDPRSDNRRRMVDLCRDAVVIRRVVAGVSMAIRVDSKSYCGVTLRIVGLEDGRFHYVVKLLHRDPGLSVLLAEDQDEAAAKAQWRKWIGFLGLPAFVGHTSSADVQVNVAGVDLVRRLPNGRRRGRGVMARRPSFLRRRKVGGLLPLETVGSDPSVDAEDRHSIVDHSAVGVRAGSN